MGGDVEGSFWLAGPYPPRPRLEDRLSLDAVVVGAGMTGAGIAWFLRGRGLRAAVLESEVAAGGASGRNLGLVTSGLGEHYLRSVAFWGRSRAAAIFRLHLSNHDLLAEVAEDVECGYCRCGSYTVADDPAEEDELRRSLPLLLQDGFRCDFLEAGEMNRALGSRGFFGGRHNPGDGAVDPVRLTRGLASAAEAAGVRLFERTPVLGLDREGRGWKVATPGAEVSAQMVFLACNAWTTSLCPGLPLEPVRGQCLSFRSRTGAFCEAPCVGGFGSEYWRGARGFLLLGGKGEAGGEEEAGFRPGTSSRVQDALDGFRAAHFPDAGGVPAMHRWSGIMAWTPDGLPIVGAVPDREGLYVAAGYTGHGFGGALLAARSLVRLALDGKDEIPPLWRIDRPVRRSPAVIPPGRKQ